MLKTGFHFVALLLVTCCSHLLGRFLLALIFTFLFRAPFISIRKEAEASALPLVDTLSSLSFRLKQLHLDSHCHLSGNTLPLTPSHLPTSNCQYFTQNWSHHSKGKGSSVFFRRLQAPSPPWLRARVGLGQRPSVAKGILSGGS